MTTNTGAEHRLPKDSAQNWMIRMLTQEVALNGTGNITDAYSHYLTLTQGAEPRNFGTAPAPRYTVILY